MRIRILVLLLIALLLVALTWPALRWLWQEWHSNKTYSHGLLIPLVSLFFAWRQVRRMAVSSAPLQPSGTGGMPLALILGGLGIIVWASAINALYIVALALIPLLIGVLWYLMGKEASARLLFPVGYWVFAVPVPVVDRLSAPLQMLTVRVATTLARWTGVPATHEGSRVILSSCDLEVGAPCSGLYSLIALLALAAVMAYVLRGPAWARITLFVLAIPFALVSNTVRVLTLLLVAERWDVGVALGMWHDWSGLAFFGLAFVLLFGVSRWLGCRELRADI